MREVRVPSRGSSWQLRHTRRCRSQTEVAAGAGCGSLCRRVAARHARCAPIPQTVVAWHCSPLRARAAIKAVGVVGGRHAVARLAGNPFVGVSLRARVIAGRVAGEASRIVALAPPRILKDRIAVRLRVHAGFPGRNHVKVTFGARLWDGRGGRILARLRRRVGRRRAILPGGPASARPVAPNSASAITSASRPGMKARECEAFSIEIYPSRASAERRSAFSGAKRNSQNIC